MLAIGVFSVAPVDAADSFWTTYDQNPSHTRTEFLPGDLLYIYWTPAGKSHNIRIYDVNDNLVVDLGIVSRPAQWQIPSDAPAGMIYYIQIPSSPGSSELITVATVGVLPEVSWAPMAASILGFATFVAFIKFRTRKTQPNTLGASI